jgi:hypothetical protein
MRLAEEFLELFDLARAMIVQHRDKYLTRQFFSGGIGDAWFYPAAAEYARGKGRKVRIRKGE